MASRVLSETSPSTNVGDLDCSHRYLSIHDSQNDSEMKSMKMRGEIKKSTERIATKHFFL